MFKPIGEGKVAECQCDHASPQRFRDGHLQDCKGLSFVAMFPFSIPTVVLPQADWPELKVTLGANKSALPIKQSSWHRLGVLSHHQGSAP